ncbi:MAG: septal ring lytic transglycosylase RlpA family protein [Hyphomicrobium sp.]|nr:septal ring lytic transglycosylase RlpA family protein [Hyphomicrobium sp.]
MRTTQTLLVALGTMLGAIAPLAVLPVLANEDLAGQVSADVTVSAWRTRVIRAPEPVDAGWTAVVEARRQPAGPELETASLGGVAKRAPHALNGIASYYWQEQKTASGEMFDRRAMTAAHPTLPMGTKVRVTNLANGRSAIVRINDRGPFKPGRVIDVSEAAADTLGMRQAGLTKVKIDVVSP